MPVRKPVTSSTFPVVFTIQHSAFCRLIHNLKGLLTSVLPR